MRKIIYFLGTLVMVSSFLGCNTPESGLQARLIEVPLVRQATDHTCGGASVASILGYYGIDMREDTLSKELNAEEFAGVEEIAAFISRQGFKVNQYEAMSLACLQELIDRKQPVMVAIQAWQNEEEPTTPEFYQTCVEGTLGGCHRL